MSVFVTSLFHELVLHCASLVFRQITLIRTATSVTRTMDHSINEQVTKLLQRLQEAERRARLLKNEIKSIRTEIKGLTSYGRSLLGADVEGVTTENSISICNSSSNVSSSKRALDDCDSLNSDNSKRTPADVSVENDYVVVYTDGACENNGKPNAKAGIGVWFGNNNPLNISKPVIGRATNNTAEIQAASEALKLLQKLGYNKVKIVTDSQFTINCITKWIHTWKKNQWRLSGGGLVKNKDDLVVLDNLCGKFADIKWEYCAGHRGIRGNEEADRLAREGALRYKSLKL